MEKNLTRDRNRNPGRGFYSKSFKYSSKNSRKIDQKSKWKSCSRILLEILRRESRKWRIFRPEIKVKILVMDSTRNPSTRAPKMADISTRNRSRNLGHGFYSKHFDQSPENGEKFDLKNGRLFNREPDRISVREFYSKLFDQTIKN